MIYIAHRGNVSGPSEFENRIDYLEHAYSLGYGIEVDVQEYKGKLYFGHDEPQEDFVYDLVNRPNVFVHLKDRNSALILGNVKELNMFSHDRDDYVFTSKGNIWGWHKVLIEMPNAIYLNFDDPYIEAEKHNVYGYCGDYYER